MEDWSTVKASARRPQKSPKLGGAWPGGGERPEVAKGDWAESVAAVAAAEPAAEPVAEPDASGDDEECAEGGGGDEYPDGREDASRSMRNMEGCSALPGLPHTHASRSASVMRGVVAVAVA